MQSWKLTKIRRVFNIPPHMIEPMTQIVIYHFHIRDMHCIAIIELVNIHHFAPKDYTSYLKWYSIKCNCKKYRVECSCLDLAYAVKKNNTLLELRSKSRLPEETAVRFLFQCHVLHFILSCLGTRPQCTIPHEPWGCNRMPLWNI